MKWDDPEARLRLIERVGADEYARLHKIEMESRTIMTVNGHAIRPMHSRFGTLMAVGNTGRAFATLDQAKAFARSNNV